MSLHVCHFVGCVIACACVCIDGQGEEVVQGERAPVPLVELRNLLPDVYDCLLHVQRLLEKHYKDMQVR